MNENEIKIKRRSKWSSIQRTLGLFLVVLGLFMVVSGIFIEARYMDFVISGTLLFIGLQSLFISFLIDVFTDIRWYLSKVTENSDLTNNYLGHQYRKSQNESLE